MLFFGCDDLKTDIFVESLYKLIQTGTRKTPWRNGSASDSRSEGCVFESRRGQKFFWTRLFTNQYLDPTQIPSLSGNLGLPTRTTCVKCCLSLRLTPPKILSLSLSLSFRLLPPPLPLPFTFECPSIHALMDPTNARNAGCFLVKVDSLTSSQIRLTDRLRYGVK